MTPPRGGEERDVVKVARENLAEVEAVTRMGIWEWDLAADHVEVTDGLCRLFGVEPGEVQFSSESFLERVHPEDREPVSQAMAAAVEGGEDYDVEFRVVLPGGEVRWLHSRGRVHRDPRGLATSMVGTAFDTSERVQAARALRESEWRFREMAENIREVFWLFDQAEQRVIYASPAFETIWGRPVSALLEDYGLWGGSIHPDDMDYAVESFERVLETGGGEPREYRIVRPDGEVRWISDRAFVIRDADGQVVRITGIAEDITDRKNQEEARRRLGAKLLHTQKLESLGVLAGGIAHDFNNLLMAILGNADLALSVSSPESPGREYLELIERAARRAADLTNQMLAYSGKGRFVVEPLRLERLVGEMVHVLETVVSKKASLVIEAAADLPPIEADASQVRQVVMNLITNASEALGEESGTVRLCLGTVEADRDYLQTSALGEGLPERRYVYLEVSDTGSGMDEATRERIFDPFFTTKFTGRGLGLAAVMGIVQGHGGAIRVYSEPGRGTSFKVLFPASEAEVAVRGPASTLPETPEGAVVLVVDDDPSVVDVTTKMLRREGFDVLRAYDGEEAVAVFREHAERVALVILDMTMPRMDGEEAFRELRRVRPDVRVVLSSGYNEQDATTRFVGRGLAGFLHKPYGSAALLAAIHDALSRSGQG